MNFVRSLLPKPHVSRLLSQPGPICVVQFFWFAELIVRDPLHQRRCLMWSPLWAPFRAIDYQAHGCHRFSQTIILWRPKQFVFPYNNNTTNNSTTPQKEKERTHDRSDGIYAWWGSLASRCGLGKTLVYNTLDKCHVAECAWLLGSCPVQPCTFGENKQPLFYHFFKLEKQKRKTSFLACCLG